MIARAAASNGRGRPSRPRRRSCPRAAGCGPHPARKTSAHREPDRARRTHRSWFRTRESPRGRAPRRVRGAPRRSPPPPKPLCGGRRPTSLPSRERLRRRRRGRHSPRLRKASTAGWKRQAPVGRGRRPNGFPLGAASAARNTPMPCRSGGEAAAAARSRRRGSGPGPGAHRRSRGESQSAKGRPPPNLDRTAR